MLAALLALALPACAAAARSAGSESFGHAGRWITDGRGRVVTLHGVNMVNKLAASGYAPDGVGFGGDDARFLRKRGFTLVRLGIIWKALEPRPGVYDDAYLGRIYRTYRVLRKHGIAVLLDFHQDMYNERFQGEGMPDWAIVGPAATENPTPQLGFPGNYLVQDAVNHAFDAFWANAQVPGTGRGVQDLLAAAWAHVAKRFRGKPGVLGYNLLNEPWPGSGVKQCALAGGGTSPEACGIAQFEATALTAFHRRVVRAIRRVDRRTMVWPAPSSTFDYGSITGVGRVGKRAGFAFNAYCGQIDPALAAVLPYLRGQPCSFSANLSFSHAFAESRRNHDALLMTEFGSTDNLPDFIDYLNEANRRQISWAYWAYCGCGDPTGSPAVEGVVLDPRLRPTGANVRWQKLLALAQPYAFSVSGTPRRSSFTEAGRRFRLTYSSRAAHGPGETRPRSVGRHGRFEAGSLTEVIVPRIQYRRGYAVRVRGARVASRPNAELLRLRLCDGARQIRLQVKPGRTARKARRCPGG